MELRELSAFREVARQSSFSRAADRLGYAQSTVSAQIASLERGLDARLFDRLGRSIVLTPAGRALLPHAEEMLDAAVNARSDVLRAVAPGDALTGSISISAPESLLTYRVPSVLTRFRDEQPGVKVELHPTPIGRLRGATRLGLSGGATDAAFVLDTPIKFPGFVAQRLVREPISVIAPAGHPLADVLDVGPGDLAGEAVLLPEAPDAGCVYRGQFEHQLTEAQVDTGDMLEFASIEAVKQCVVAGMGISVLPSVTVEAEVASGRLVCLAWREPFDAYTQLVWNERRSVSPALAAFIDVAQRTFRID